MNKFLPIQFQLNGRSFLKLGLISLALSLSVGTSAQVQAQSVPELEVLSVPPQEAFLIEDKSSVTSPKQDSKSEDEDTSYERSKFAYLSDSLGLDSQQNSDVK
jgi:hypothetical protein